MKKKRREGTPSLVSAKRRNMTKNALETMESGGVLKKDVYMRRGFWALILFLSIIVMVISLVIFYLTGKPNNMEESIVQAVTVPAKICIILYAAIGATEMWWRDPPSDPPKKMSPGERAGFEMTMVVLPCIVTLMLGKMVEVFFYSLSFIIGAIAIGQLGSTAVDDHDDDFDKMVNHLCIIIKIGIVIGLVCLIPNLFFFIGWLSIFILSYLYILRFNFVDNSIYEVLDMVVEKLGFE